jgi:hypothetical protein
MDVHRVRLNTLQEVRTKHVGGQWEVGPGEPNVKTDKRRGHMTM